MKNDRKCIVTFLCALAVMVLTEVCPAHAAVKPTVLVPRNQVKAAVSVDSEGMRIKIKNKSKKYTIKKAEYIYRVTYLAQQEEAPESEGAVTTGEAITVPEDTESVTSGVAMTATEVVEGSTSGEAITVQEPELITKEVTEKVSFVATRIEPGKIAVVEKKGKFNSGADVQYELLRVSVTAGKARVTYNAITDKESVLWSTPDTTAPVITGWVGGKSHNAKDTYLVIYTDKKYDLTKYVSAKDDRDGKVKVTADTSKVNFKKSGVYTVTYKAADRAGNVAKARAQVEVRVKNELDSYADQILAGIIKEKWTDKQKAEAIYKYVRKNYSYVDSNDHASWENSALYGLRYHSGNCFVFYSVSRLLLTRCGIPNIEVKRSAGSRHGHWWNYVYIDGGWYHFDTTPRRARAIFCLLTDEQLTTYSRSAGNSHIWDKSLYPKGATKQIAPLIYGKNY